MYDMMFSPMNIGTMTVKNRIVMTAAEFSLGQANGCPTERMINYYEARARGGVGLIIPGICRVNDMGATSTFSQLSMAHDWQIEPMRAMVERIHACGAKLGIQLHHPGRQGYGSSINSLPLVIPIQKRFPGVMKLMFKVAPTLMALEEKGISQSVQAPSKCELSQHGATRLHAMSLRAVKKLRDDFIAAAVRCKKAGVDCVELHATHGYILQQFLSPNTNFRIDEYGGSFENRFRLLREIVEGIKEQCGKDYPLIVRLCADEMYDRIGCPGKGYDLEYGKRVAKRLEEAGVDAIDVSSACYDTYNFWLEPTSFEPGWRAYLAKEIKQVVSVPVIAANYIRSPEQAERQLQEGVQDFIGSARTFICDPEWAKKAEEGHPEKIRRCIGCLYCIRSFIANATVGGVGECALNPAVGIEKEYAEMPDVGQGRAVLVAGAGVAGLSAAITLKRRGFDVTVIEKEKKPGGQVNTAAAGPYKEKLHWAVEDLFTEASDLGVKFEFGKKADAALVKKRAPYAVVIASGSTPVRPRSIPGIALDNVCTASEILEKKVRLKKKKVAVIGSGLTGLETTEALLEQGNEVVVIEMADTVAPGAWFQFVDDSLSRIKPHGTKIMTGTALSAIGTDHITVMDVKTKKRSFIPADNVVLAMGVRPENSLEKELDGLGVKTLCVGDAAKGGTIGNAVHDAFSKAMQLM
ncbi:MAG: FAD-dependent oxidoreductase [Clostridia bacterium]|nr:FAD-dependent oxidoreductase [Clostridia bacterium]